MNLFSSSPLHLTLVLASTSLYRRELLERLQIPFECQAPNVDETPRANESATQLVRRLAIAKAQAVQTDYPHALIIGSDQCAVLGETILGKPHTHERAIEQLKASSGKRVEFLTGLCLLNTHTNTYEVDVVSYAVQFRNFNEVIIENYLQREQPYNCAGSFKSEGLGITLFERMIGDDPTALIGLPLIRLVSFLSNQGIILPLAATPKTP